MFPECSNPTKCSTSNMVDLCEPCNIALEEAAVQSALNFGISPSVACYDCGGYMTREAFISHLPCGTS